MTTPRAIPACTPALRPEEVELEVAAAGDGVGDPVTVAALGAVVVVSPEGTACVTESKDVRANKLEILDHGADFSKPKTLIAPNIHVDPTPTKLVSLQCAVT